MMSHRYRIQASKARWSELESKTNKAMLKVLGYAVIAAILIYFAFLVATHPFDNNVKRCFEIIGVLFLASLGVFWGYKKVTGKL